MKTPFILLLCLFSLLTANGQNATTNAITSPPPPTAKKTAGQPTKGSKEPVDIPVCNGNGLVTFFNTASQPLWFFYWYPEDVANAADECRFRRFWKVLQEGNNAFVIPKSKTLIFRIYTSTKCRKADIKQFGIVHYCNANNAIVRVN